MSKIVAICKNAVANKNAQIATAVTLASFSGSASADVGAAATAGAAAITAGAADIQAVQAAIIGLAAVALVGTWVKATFF
ncbi:hypothetical protein [Photobacterium toruni]|uniref:hypothetical protein n=1 Tax=Photobacterium toruni TaxID=1935446 RepID=UPI00210FF556|nr:hypothetical protein [Photobacterium toruni]